MVFSSLVFLFFFLPVALFLYYMSPGKGKNIVLLVVSLFFYAWGEPVYIFLMIFSAIIDYIHGIIIHKYRLTRPGLSKAALISSLLVNIGILSFFKYADFLIENLNQLIGTNLTPLDLPLPIGISFYTFQTMSYCIDIYRGQVLPQRNPLHLALYVTLFPQLIAGPIVRYQLISEELEHRKYNANQFSEGIKLFIIGLGKKVLLANNIGLLWSEIQSQSLNELTILTAWLGIIAFAMQIYFDFSGYSDMAIGLGKMFGFNFPRNFNYPYISRNITEFWRRWHMTLGAWFRDYVYIPLGGSKKGKAITYRNLLIVWGLTGLWHGASWNFAIWGLYFGLLILLEKAGLLQILNKFHPFFQHLYFIVLILVGWVLFVFEDITMGVSYLSVMFGLSMNDLFDFAFLYRFYTNIILLLIAMIGSTPAIIYIRNKWLKGNFFVHSVVISIFYMIILFLSTAYLVDESYNPFLYFRF